MILKRYEIVRELAKRSGMHIKEIDKIWPALESMFVDCLNKAALDDDVEIHIAKGLIIGARIVPEHAGKDPRDQSDIVVPEKVIPYAKFSHRFKEKINK